MTGLTGHLGVGSLQGKLRVPFMHEFFSGPQICRSVATLTLGLSILLELPSVGVQMAGIACLGCGSELPHLGIGIDAMALDTGHSPMCACQGIGFTMLGRSQGCGHKSI